jgi:ubiquinone/menaquinone biosynthesis C-methylase UbiE
MGKDLPLPPAEFYRALTEHMNAVDPSWMEDAWQRQVGQERAHLGRVLGHGEGRAVLDCSCGTGAQAIALAQLGWSVTGTDIDPAALVAARRHADRVVVAADFQLCDLRELDNCFRRQFDLVMSCMALDNLIEDADLHLALAGMYGALKPGGSCYIRLRDFDHLLAVRPRYEVKAERVLPGGKGIRMEDWEYEDEGFPVYVQVFLKEDREARHPWISTAFRLRRRALRSDAMRAHLTSVGFEHVEIRKSGDWSPYEMLAMKVGAAL